MKPQGRLQLVFHSDDPEPTLHIHAGVEGLRRLRDLFEQLAGDAPKEIDLTDLSGVESEGVYSVVLSQIRTKDDFVKAVAVTRDRRGEVTIGWSRGPSGWEWCAELVDPLLSSAAAGHFQYMTQSAWDETEIKLEYKDLDTGTS